MYRQVMNDVRKHDISLQKKHKKTLRVLNVVTGPSPRILARNFSAKGLFETADYIFVFHRTFNTREQRPVNRHT